MPHDQLAAEFGDNVHFLIVYVREPHSGERYQMHTSYGQKRAYAQDLIRLEGVRRRVLIDSVEGDVHRAYGAWPNMLLVIDTEGVIVLRQRWGDPIVVRETLDRLLQGEPVTPRTTRDFRIKGPLLRVMLRAGRTATVDFFFKGGIPVLYAIPRLWESFRRSIFRQT